MDKHSIKTAKTIELLNTQPTDWGLVEIKWVRETRTMPVHVKCPTCVHGEAWLRPDGTVHDFWVDANGEKRISLTGGQRAVDINDYHLNKKACPKCPPSRKWPGRGTAEIVVWKPMEVWVGYPQWHPTTKFDSRFASHDRSNCRVCELCSKSITGIFSGLVPVTGKGADGIIHGMWVGQDCARKFFGIKNFKKDQIIEVK